MAGPAPLDGERWAPWRQDPGHAGVLLDFDGTLSAIVEDPEDARLMDGAAAVLAALARRYRAVAMISGRPASFLAAAVDVPGLERFGSYGLDWVAADGTIEAEPGARQWQEQVRGVVADARAAAPPDVYVEDKGLTVTFHYRTAPHRQAWVERYAAEQGARTGLAVHPARKSLELAPPLAVDKGTAVTRIVAGHGLRAACYVGDDLGDLPAFRALAAVEHAVRVVVRSDESPPEVLAAADVIVDGPAGALALLAALAAP